MVRFPRPENTIVDATDLKLGDEIYNVCGIWPPFIDGPYIVVRETIPFSQHPEYTDWSIQGSLLVFDIKEKEKGYIRMEFVRDGNLEPGYSHNDNYWLRSKKDAEAARIFLHNKYTPSQIQEELDERELDERELDRLADDHAESYDDWEDEECRG